MTKEVAKAENNGPVPYMARTREYYRALGYEKDYIWAQYDDVPFASLPKPVHELQVALITTSSPIAFADLMELPRQKKVWSGPTENAPQAFFTNNVAWDKESTHTRDRESFLPLNAFRQLAAEGIIGDVTARFHGVPTDYSQRQSIEEFAPEVRRRCQADAADVAFLMPL